MSAKTSKFPPQYRIKLTTVPAEGDKPQRNIGAEIVKIVLTQPAGQNGFGIDEIAKRVPLIKRLEVDPTELIVNESEKQIVLEAYKSFRFGVAGTEILDTYNAIVNAESCTLSAV